MRQSVDAVVTGAGGFIGGHLTGELVRQGLTVRAVDVKQIDDWYQVWPEADNLVRDLSLDGACREAVSDAREVFHLAADMGGMGFIESHKADCMLSVLSDTHMLQAARDADVGMFFYASSACVYGAEKQIKADVQALTEADAYPAMPEDGYGWEKLFTERMCRHFTQDYGLPTRVARYHNVYGPDGTWTGGREKAPAAICRKVAEAVLTGAAQIEIWGDGEQTRSFMYIDDCIRGTLTIARGRYGEPVNLGSSELVTINQLVTVIEDIAGTSLKRVYDLDAPKGVRGRNSDNTLIRRRHGWEPAVRLTDGLVKTYAWVFHQVQAQLASQNRVGVGRLTRT